MSPARKRSRWLARLAQRRLRSALRQRTVFVTPGVKRRSDYATDIVVPACSSSKTSGWYCATRSPNRAASSTRTRRCSGSTAGSNAALAHRPQHYVLRARRRLSGSPDAGVAAIMHGIIDQARVAAQGDAAAGSGQVCFGGDGILLVAQIVAHVRQKFDQCHAQVGRVSLASTAAPPGPAGRAGAAGSSRSPSPGSRSPARPAPRRRGRGGRPAVEITGAGHLEREVDCGQPGIEAWRRLQPSAACTRRRV